MPKVKPKHPNESFEALLRRFKRVVDNADVIKDIRKKDFYEKPTAVRKRKKAAANAEQGILNPRVVGSNPTMATR